MPALPDILRQIFFSTADFLIANHQLILAFLTSALGAGFGAWFGARAIVQLGARKDQADIQAAANISIAAMVALLGKLINFKKDLSFPAQAEAKTLSETLSSPAGAPEKTKVSITLELWPEIPFDLRMPFDRLFEQARHELDLIQLIKMLDYNLAELVHLVRQRNELIRQMNAHQLAKGALPPDGLQLYLRYAGEIARNVDENLFFIDRAIKKVRAAARKLLPASLHGGIADVGLKAEASPLMPPKDLIKGWVK